MGLTMAEANERLQKMGGSFTILEIVTLEREILNTIEEEFNSYNPKESFSNSKNQNIFTEIKKFDPLLIKLREMRAHSVQKNIASLPNELKQFIDKLKFADKSTCDKPFIVSQLFKIFSRPIGKKLILEVNKLLGENVITFKTPGNGRTSISTKSAINAIFIHYPSSLHAQIDITSSLKNKFTPFPPFIKVAHELIHIWHYLANTHKGRQPFPENTEGKILKALFNNLEEYYTIFDGEITENAVRREHGLDPRSGHTENVYIAEVEVKNEIPMKRENNTYTYHLFLTALLKGEKDFSNWHFENITFNRLPLEGINFSRATFDHVLWNHCMVKNCNFNDTSISSWGRSSCTFEGNKHNNRFFSNMGYLQSNNPTTKPNLPRSKAEKRKREESDEEPDGLTTGLGKYPKKQKIDHQETSAPTPQ